MTIYVFDAFGEEEQIDFEQIVSLLPKWKREEVAKIKSRGDALRAAISYFVLAYALKKEYDIDGEFAFYYERHGKPYFAEYGDIKFNLTHCKEAVCAAVSDNEIGVDAESYGRCNFGVVSKICNNAEIALLNEEIALSANENTNQVDRIFTEIWVKKEAYSKMTGNGFSQSFKSIDTTSLHPPYHDTIAEPTYFVAISSVAPMDNIKLQKVTLEEII